MMGNNLQALLVDDDLEFADDFRKLMPDGMSCDAVTNTANADHYLLTRSTEIVFLDINLGEGEDGLDYLGRLRSEWPYLPVIMVTGNQEVGTVVKAMRLGAADFVGKSPDLEKLKITVDRAIAGTRLQKRCDLLESELDDIKGRLVGESASLLKIKAEMKSLGEVASTVLITGQSGTGKELVARGIHRMSEGRRALFVAVNCAALSRELIESELFGHEKGAFTGAVGRRIGKFELTGTGTLFLDEITEIPVDVQAKLLRVLQEREFERVGGNQLLPFSGRILASSNRDMEKALADGLLRQDLYFRLNVTHIDIPPLAEHTDDIPLLVDYFVKIKALEMKKNVVGVSAESMNMLTAYDWPGNVRELINCLEHAIVHAQREILEPDDLCVLVLDNQSVAGYEDAKKRCLTNFQRKYISSLLRKNNGSIGCTAEEMGVTRQGLAKMMKACGLSQ
ncbi:MAG: sigma-54-dependent Fis family transcriptional regulator [FCB group bacterium]|nr:sigma-54-dependent Fis family transcriptional regulator [FCB group bacterium]